jgi:hypothetical protein
MEQSYSPITKVTQQPLFDPTYLNIEYVFNKILEFIQPFISFITNPNMWLNLGILSSLISIFLIAIIIFCLVRMGEIQRHEKEEIAHEIHEAHERNQKALQKTNPRWHYILNLIESPNESDWRVGIIEADSMLEEVLKEKGYSGDTLGELLESAKSGGLMTIQNAWDAHLVRNQIAHTGTDFYLSQIEARRVSKMFQNVFEELRVI